VDALDRELLHDQGRFARFLVESADVVSAVVSRRPQLTQRVGSGRTTLGAIAGRNASLDSLLRRMPETLREGNTTLVNLRAALGDVDPTLRAARPVSRPLADTLELLQPTARDLRPLVARLRRTVYRPGSADLIGVLRELPPLERSAVPALTSATATVNDLLPIVTEARPYAPDVVGGLFNGFGGTTSGYYDANGHYTRISFQSSTYSPEGIASLLPVPSSMSGLTGYERDNTARCPGAAAQPAPDRSNPRAVPGCDPGDGPP